MGRARAYRLNGKMRLYFPPEFEGFVPVLVHSFSMDKTTQNRDIWTNYAGIVFKNSKDKFIKAVGLLRELNAIIYRFKLDKNSYICFNNKNEAWTERSRHTNLQGKNYNTMNYVDLVDLLLAKGGKWEYDEPGEDFVELEDGYDFSHLIPDCVLIKEAIEQYCERMDPVKLATLQNENATLKASLEVFKNSSARARIHAHLAYKLGSAMIKHSKSLRGYLKMPFVLLALSIVHKENLSTSPQTPLESYPDYAEALREQNCLTYKLGLALMRANKTWYKGGYVRLIFEVRRLKGEFKKT